MAVSKTSIGLHSRVQRFCACDCIAAASFQQRCALASVFTHSSELEAKHVADSSAVILTGRVLLEACPRGWHITPTPLRTTDQQNPSSRHGYKLESTKRAKETLRCGGCINHRPSLLLCTSPTPRIDPKAPNATRSVRAVKFGNLRPEDDAVRHEQHDVVQLLVKYRGRPSQDEETRSHGFLRRRDG